MHYEEIASSPSLRPWVRCLWHLRGEAGTADADRVVPDGCPEIIIQRGDPFREYQPTSRAESLQSARLLLAGQLTGPLWLTPTGTIDCIGIRFEPHGLAALIETPATQFLDVRQGLSAVDASLGDRLRRASEGPAPLDSIQEELELRLVKNSAGVPSWVAEAVRRISAHTATLRISEWAVDLGVDPRTAQRGFRRAIGLSPKRLHRVLRFQSAYGRLGEATCSVDLALDCGYYDQAHMIRDFRQFAGRSPGRDPVDELLSQWFAGVLEDPK